ncbi:MAG: lysylphosphatidylglycerol synthase domain-containing protein, partial [Prosthecobacter sp.]
MPLRPLFHLLRLLCAVGLLWWVMRRLRMEEIAAFEWSAVDLRWLLLAFVLGGLSLLGWAGRWWWFLRVYGVQARFGELLRLTMFADFFNLYFLGPLGADGVRLLHLARFFPERRGAIVGSLLLDHIGGLFGGMALYWA